MGRGNDHAALAATLCEATDAAEQQRTTGDRFKVFLWNSQTHKQVPPVVDKHHRARHDLAGLKLFPHNHWMLLLDSLILVEVDQAG